MPEGMVACNSPTEGTEYILNEFLEYELGGEKCSNTQNKNILFQHHQIQLSILKKPQQISIPKYPPESCIGRK